MSEYTSLAGVKPSPVCSPASGRTRTFPRRLTEEIGHERVPAVPPLDQDVGGGQVRVDETAGVCGVKSVCDLTEQAKRRARVGPPLCEQLRKGRRIHEPAHDVETGGPGHFGIDELAPIEKRQQVRMLDGGALGEEWLEPIPEAPVLAKATADELDGSPLAGGVACLVNGVHAPGARDDPLEPIPGQHAAGSELNVVQDSGGSS